MILYEILPLATSTLSPTSNPLSIKEIHCCKLSTVDPVLFKLESSATRLRAEVRAKYDHFMRESPQTSVSSVAATSYLFPCVVTPILYGTPARGSRNNFVSSHKTVWLISQAI
jgi:hypothetical protein